MTGKTVCIVEHSCLWSSEPQLENMAAGNLAIAAGILFTGNTYGRVSDFCNLLHLALLWKTQFYRLQKRILFPVINKHYELSKTSIVSHMKSLAGLQEFENLRNRKIVPVKRIHGNDCSPERETNLPDPHLFETDLHTNNSTIMQSPPPKKLVHSHQKKGKED